MPKERFLKLPDEKRRRICQAVYDELLRVSYDELSINQIIQKAGISRGSFYQYFQDTDDLLTYMMQDLQQRCMVYVKNSIQNQKGDIFDVCLEVVNKMIAFGEKEEHYHVLKNIFSDLKVGRVHSFEVFCGIDEAFVREMYPFLQKDEFVLKDVEQFIELAKLLADLVRGTCAQIFINITHKKEILNQFKWRLTVIRRGVLKREEFM